MSMFFGHDIIASRFPFVSAKLKAIDKTGSTGLPATFPKELAVMWAAAQAKNPKPDTLYMVAGFGEHVEALLARIDASSLVIVYESSVNRLHKTLESKDYTPVVADARLALMAGNVTSSEFEPLLQLPLVRIRDIQQANFSLARSLDEGAYERYFGELVKQIDVMRRLHLANFNDSLFWQANTLENLPLLAGAPDVGVLRDLFPELPVVLVGAGPSLDEADDFLRSIGDRAIVVAVNSSYRKVLKLGVVPHMVLAADPREDTFRGFEGQSTDDVFLVSPFIVSPKVVKAFGGRAFSWSGDNNALVKLLRFQQGLGEGTMLIEKGTVSLCVADLAVLMGSRQIILVGQDMAITPEGVTHTKESFYADDKSHKLNLDTASDNPNAIKTRKVPGNTTETVPTLENLFVYLKSFEQWVQSHPAMRVVNTARLGAKITGASYVTYNQARELLSESSGHVRERLQEAFKNAPENKKTFEDWKASLGILVQFSWKLYGLALGGAVALESLPERLLQPAYANQKEVIEIATIANQINAQLDKNSAFYAVLLEGGLKKRLLEYQRLQRTIEAPSAHTAQLLQNKEFFWALVEGLEPILGLFQKIMEPAEPQEA